MCPAPYSVILPVVSIVVNEVSFSGKDHTIGQTIEFSLLNYDRWMMGILAASGFLGTLFKAPAHISDGFSQGQGLKHLAFSVSTLGMFAITVAALVIAVSCASPEWAASHAHGQYSLDAANLLLTIEIPLIAILVFGFNRLISANMEEGIESFQADL